jgi:tRNA pseudouridine38-40 synthase
VEKKEAGRPVRPTPQHRSLVPGPWSLIVRVLKLTLAYDGTAYVGWQRQADGTSIQALVEDALSRIDGRPVVITGAGRTDAGVHAIGQVARAEVHAAHDAPTFLRALNGILPADVRVVRVEEAAPAFHPRYGATSKTYQYWLWNAPVLPPAVRHWCWHVARDLDVDAMNAAARLFEGRHDFACFQSTGSDVKTTVRTVVHAEVRRERRTNGADSVANRLGASAAAFVVFEIEADGFLRHMVRAMMGTLVEIGAGRRAAGTISSLLATGARAEAGPTAPAHGLVLVNVQYPDP